MQDVFCEYEFKIHCIFTLSINSRELRRLFFRQSSARQSHVDFTCVAICCQDHSDGSTDMLYIVFVLIVWKASPNPQKFQLVLR